MIKLGVRFAEIAQGTANVGALRFGEAGGTKPMMSGLLLSDSVRKASMMFSSAPMMLDT